MSDRLDAARANAIARGTLAGLHEALKERLVAVVAQFPLLETKDTGVQRAPNVLDGWLPPKTSSDVENFPFLLVRPHAGQDDEQKEDQRATAIVEIVIGTFSDTDDGWLDVVEIIDAIRADLVEAPILEGTAFEHIGPLTWEVPKDQPRPQWFGTVNTNWQLPRPRRVDARDPHREA